MLERNLEQLFAARVKSLGGLSIKLVPTLAGVPDRLVVLDGRVFFVELKTDTGRLSKIQGHRIGQLESLGATVYVLYGADEIRGFDGTD